jgi:hypothetical protein
MIEVVLMKTVPWQKYLAYGWGCLLLSAIPGFAYSTGGFFPQRLFDKSTAQTNSSVTVTVTLTNGTGSIWRGVEYTEYIPSGLAVAPGLVTVNGIPVTNNIFETGIDGDVYSGCTSYRWVLETPPAFAQSNLFTAPGMVRIQYSLSSPKSGIFNLQQFSWCGYGAANTNASFGYSEGNDVQAVIFTTNAPALTGADAVVLVNSGSPCFPDFQRRIQPYLDNFGVPYTVLDIANSRVDASISRFALIIIGHNQLDTNGGLLDAAAQFSLAQAITNGTGLVNFDNYLFNGGSPIYPYLQNIFGMATGSSVSGSSVVMPPAAGGQPMHFITSLHTPGELLSLKASLAMPGFVLPGNVSAVAICGGQPLVRLRNPDWGGPCSGAATTGLPHRSWVRSGDWTIWFGAAWFGLPGSLL